MVGLCCFWVSRRQVGLGFGSGLHIDCQGSNRGAMNLIAAKKAKRPTPENWPNFLILKPGARSGNRTIRIHERFGGLCVKRAKCSQLPCVTLSI